MKVSENKHVNKTLSIEPDTINIQLYMHFFYYFWDTIQTSSERKNTTSNGGFLHFEYVFY